VPMEIRILFPFVGSKGVLVYVTGCQHSYQHSKNAK
jgi:hypothetical protein